MSVVMQKQRQVRKDERIEKIILQNNIPRMLPYLSRAEILIEPVTDTRKQMMLAL